MDKQANYLQRVENNLFKILLLNIQNQKIL